MNGEPVKEHPSSLVPIMRSGSSRYGSARGGVPSHGDVPAVRQQRFANYTRSLLKALYNAELDDIQSGVLFPRPTPYAATYLLFRIDNRKAGRELMRRTTKVVASAAHPISPAGDAWFSVALTFQGLKVLGVPAKSLKVSRPSSSKGWRRGPRSSEIRARIPPITGKSHSGGLRSTSCSPPWPPTERASMRFWRRHEALTRH